MQRFHSEEMRRSTDLSLSDYSEHAMRPKQQRWLNGHKVFHTPRINGAFSKLYMLVFPGKVLPEAFAAVSSLVSTLLFWNLTSLFCFNSHLVTRAMKCVIVCWCVSHQRRSTLPNPFPESTSVSCFRSHAHFFVLLSGTGRSVRVTPAEVFRTGRTGNSEASVRRMCLVMEEGKSCQMWRVPGRTGPRGGLPGPGEVLQNLTDEFCIFSRNRKASFTWKSECVCFLFFWCPTEGRS